MDPPLLSIDFSQRSTKREERVGKSRVRESKKRGQIERGQIRREI